MFLCLLYAPIHQNKFQVGVNLLGNKYYSDSDSDSHMTYATVGIEGEGSGMPDTTLVPLEVSWAKFNKTLTKGDAHLTTLVKCSQRHICCCCSYC